MEFCCIFNTPGSTDKNNFESCLIENPLFVKFTEAEKDFHLQSTSPCIDAGDPDEIYNDTDGSRNDIGPLGGPNLHISGNESNKMRGDVNNDGSITPADAQATFELYMKIVSGEITATSPYPDGSDLWLADFNGDGDVTPSDAQAIFEAYVQTISGKTTRKSVRAIPMKPLDAVALAIDLVNGTPNTTVTVPIRLSQADNITSFSFAVNYPSDQLEFIELDRSGTLTETFSTVSPIAGTDKVTIAGFAGMASAITGEGILIQVKFKVKDTASDGLHELSASNLIDGLRFATAAAGSVQAGNSTVEFSISNSGYVPGGETLLTVRVEYEEKPNALGMVINDLPDDWTFQRIEENITPVQPTEGSSAPLQFGWVQIPESPVTLIIVLNVPEDEAGVKTVSGWSTYRVDGPEIQSPFSSQVDQTYHTADTDRDYGISFNELMRVIQLFNSAGYHCADTPSSTEDGYVPASGKNKSRQPHSSDYNPQDWIIDLNETLRTIQFFNAGGYAPDLSGEDGFIPVFSSGNEKIDARKEKYIIPFAETVQAMRVRSVEGSTVDITVTIMHGGDLTALGVQETLPEGWIFESVLSGNTAIAPSPGTSGQLDFAWIMVPCTPVTLTYRVNNNGGDPQAFIDGIISYRTSGSEETVTIKEETPVPSFPTPSPTPIPSTPAPASFTPTPTPSSSTTPVPNEDQQVFIYDNPEDTTGNLTGQTDFDPIDSRNLSIVWTADQGTATDWHVYVRKGIGGVKFLGQTGSGSIMRLDWQEGGANLADEFANGPNINAVYYFRVVRIDDQRSADDYLNAVAPVGLNVEGGNALKLTRPEVPNLLPRQFVIYDDILGGNDLAPSGSTGADRDTTDSRAIQLAWNFGSDSDTVNEYHIFVREDGGQFEYLGQTYDGNINYFWWTPNGEFMTAPKYAGGPQPGRQYQFRVILLPLSGNRLTLTSGTLNYLVSN